MNTNRKTQVLTKEQAGQEIVAGVTLGSVSDSIQAINAFQTLVRSQLKDKLDYGKIPGTDKNTLLKPGAEKIAKLLRCSDRYEIIEKVEDWDRPLFSFKVKCTLAIMGTDNIVSEGIGECNSMESKYRFRWVYERDIPKGLLKEDLVVKQYKGQTGPYCKYRLDNDDVYSQINTIMKMAKKRALVDAALSAGRLSDIFTQDIEEVEFAEQDPVVGTKPDVEPPQAKEEPKEFAKCESCAIGVEKEVHDYSKAKYKKVLCRTCQKNEKPNGR